MEKGQMVKMMAVGLVMVMAAGCATTGFNKADKMARSMQQTKQDVSDATTQVTATVKALDLIMRAEVGDLRPLVTAYSKNLVTLGKMADKAAVRAQNIKSSGADYFASWAQEIEAIQNAQTRANSLKRLETAKGDYREVESALILVRDGYKPMMKELLDIEKALQQDLTKAGVNAVRQPHAAAKQKAVALQTLMTQSLTVIDRVTKDLAPTAAQ